VINVENQILKGLIDDGTPLTKAILKMAEDYARGYQPASNDIAKGWQGYGEGRLEDV
jgi:hypothetical protein